MGNFQEVQGRRVLVTGAAGGIGRKACQTLAQLGASVILLDHDEQLLAAAIKDLRPANAPTHSLAVDIGDASSVARIQHGLADFGIDRVDYLINCAGISPKVDGRRLPAWEVDPLEWHRVLAVNLSGYFHAARAVLPGMIAARFGSIVNIGSSAGLRFSKIAGIAYVASKAGVQGLTYQLAGEVGEFGIRVNCVAPGRIETPMSTIAAPGINEAAIAATPLRRLGTPIDIVGSVLFLLSDAASFVTGQTIEVNGGRGL